MGAKGSNTVLVVTGMTCDHCERRVRDALGKVVGVTEVISVDRSKGEAVVTTTEGMARELLVDAVVTAGYSAR